MTLITDDILSFKFRDYVENHEVHEAYRFSGGTRVQISCVVEFSNKTLQIDTVAKVVPLASVPNGKSGVLLGQRGVMDSLRYELVPRKIAVREDPTFPDDRWGGFDIKCYCGLDGMLHHYG